VHSAIEGNRTDLAQKLVAAEGSPVRAARDMARTIQKVSVSFGPDHFETNCGIKVRGARVKGLRPAAHRRNFWVTT